MQATLKSMHEGNPCDKAQTIRKIFKELQNDELPSTSDLDEECQSYLTAMANRPTDPPEVAAVATDAPIDHFPEAKIYVAPEISEELCAPGALVLDGETLPTADMVVAVPTTAVEQVSSSASQSHISSSILGGSSLLQRIQMHQEGRQQQRQSARAEEVTAVVLEDAARVRDSELDLVV
jgi:hypothetical protein